MFICQFQTISEGSLVCSKSGLIIKSTSCSHSCSQLNSFRVFLKKKPVPLSNIGRP